MKSKKKYPTKKEIETNWADWKDAGPEATAKALKRNAQLRAKKEGKITARVNLDDLEGFKQVAADKAIPYQTLLGHIIHEYVMGRLVSVEDARKVLKVKAS